MTSSIDVSKGLVKIEKTYYTRGNSAQGIDCDYHKEVRISTTWPKIDICCKIQAVLRTATISEHLQAPGINGYFRLRIL